MNADLPTLIYIPATTTTPITPSSSNTSNTRHSNTSTSTTANTNTNPSSMVGMGVLLAGGQRNDGSGLMVRRSTDGGGSWAAASYPHNTSADGTLLFHPEQPAPP
jgi:hypothetical protein